MSTYYVIVPRNLNNRISASELFDGRLEKFGVRECIVEATNEQNRLLTDDNDNRVWVLVVNGKAQNFKVYAGCENPDHIFDAIRKAFGGGAIYSEHEPQFSGFETEEEWYAAWEADEAAEEIGTL
jgi:hypothetical protein